MGERARRGRPGGRAGEDLGKIFFFLFSYRGYIKQVQIVLVGRGAPRGWSTISAGVGDQRSGFTVDARETYSSRPCGMKTTLKIRHRTSCVFFPRGFSGPQ